MDGYHLRLSEKEITDREEMLEIIERESHLTFAMCRGDEPYLVTVNYAFDAAEDAFYVHCATEGKKLDILEENPRVWGQVLTDDGYMQGECNHAFRSVHFGGTAEMVTDREEMLRALTLMVDHLEDDPAPVRERLVVEGKMGDVAIIRIRVEEMTGKRNG
ncbi:MAG: pyridoxamine 5'-phosphate oxidase family protein [Planctomycetota bacterium]